MFNLHGPPAKGTLASATKSKENFYFKRGENDNLIDGDDRLGNLISD
ncbi:hypothetical protein KC850_02435 [Candidatus Kaiserbacteria bacterium]|nr:hypothetical protein [Candidatus Kaiserbacteria bacterium]